MEDRILKALIIHHFVDERFLNTDELNGINNILENFSSTTLKAMCNDLDIDINY